jgi:hypothetical protein
MTSVSTTCSLHSWMTSNYQSLSLLLKLSFFLLFLFSTDSPLLVNTTQTNHHHVPVTKSIRSYFSNLSQIILLVLTNFGMPLNLTMYSYPGYLCQSLQNSSLIGLQTCMLVFLRNSLITHLILILLIM